MRTFKHRPAWQACSMALMLASTAAGCGASDPPADVKPIAAKPPLVGYEIVGMMAKGGASRYEVRLVRPASVDELAAAAEHICGECSGLKSGRVLFFLPEHGTSNGAWAIASFDPALKIELMGASAEQLARSLATMPMPPKGELKGSWRDSSPMYAGWVQLVKHGKRYAIERTLAVGVDKPGPHIEDNVVPHKTDSTRFNDVEGEDGEYYQIHTDGALLHYATDHLIARHELPSPPK